MMACRLQAETPKGVAGNRKTLLCEIYETEDEQK